MAVATTGGFFWGPAASAESPGITSPTTASPVPHNATEPEPGGVTILKKDPAGDVLAGASFTLIDTEGRLAGSGKTDTAGRLAFTGLAPGVYRLKEVSSGSTLHDTVDDRDVIVTPGAITPLTVIDPFKPADLLVKKTDKKTGKPLAGAVINIIPSTGTGTAITLTTGKDGTATVKLPVSSRQGTLYTGTEIRAPAGYELDTTPVRITAKPAGKTTVTFTNTKKARPTQPSTPPPTTTPPVTQTTPPTGPATTAPATPTAPGTPIPTQAPSAGPVSPADSPTGPAAEGSLAHTGTDSTAWLLAVGGLLVTAGGGALIAVRRRKSGVGEDSPATN